MEMELNIVCSSSWLEYSETGFFGCLANLCSPLYKTLFRLVGKRKNERCDCAINIVYAEYFSFIK